LERHHKNVYAGGLLTQTKFTTYYLILTDEAPFSLPPFRYSAKKKKTIQEQAMEIVADNVIEATLSPYSLPIVIFAKQISNVVFTLIINA
jgi:hypothetical protein